VLTVGGGSFGIQSPLVGQVSRVDVQPGAAPAPGAVVVEVTGAGGPVQVRTAVSGRVAEVSARLGQPVAPGDVLCVLERVTGGDDPVVAVVYVAVQSGAVVLAGQRVDIAVDAAPAAVFGKIRGRVVEAGTVLEGRREVAEFLADDDMAALLTADGPARRVVVELLRDRSTPSGYQWTRGSGPPFPIGTRTTVRGTLHQRPLRPVDWVLP
jgi:hypothetical protein